MASGSDELDALLGKLALERGWVDSPTLVDCLRECGSSATTRLADVLVSRGVQANAVEEMTRELTAVLARSDDWEHIRSEDIKLAKELVARRVLTEDAAKRALRTQAEEAKGDAAGAPRLAAILLRDGLARFEALKPFLHAGPRLELACPQCNATYLVPETGAGRRWTCRKCRAELGRREGGSLVLKDADVPEEARAAMADERRRFGRYHLVRELGRGGMGAVYQAWEPALKRFVAVKVILGQAGSEEVGRFYREAQVAARLKHPNIISIFDVSKNGDRHYIAMEYVDGRPLGGERMPARRAAEIVAQAARALDAAHEQGVVHRDVKPGNLMLDRDGKVWIMDFGLAKPLAAHNRLTTAGSVVGTPSYMSPEQAQGRACDRVSDTYSLGAVLFDLLTGRPPFRSNNPVQTLNDVLTKDPPSPSSLNPGVSRELEAIVQKAMEKERSRRYRTARDLADDLDRWLRGEPVSAKPVGAASRLGRALRRRWPIVAGALTAAVVLVVGSTLLLGSNTRLTEAVDAAIREGDRAMEAGDWRKALAAFENALRLDPTHAEAGARRKSAADRIAADESTARAAEEALRAARTDVDAGDKIVQEAERDFYRRGADLAKTQESLREAVRRYGAAIEKSSRATAAWFGRGRAHALLDELEAAESDFTEAIRLDPEHAAALRERGKIRLGRYLAEVQSGHVSVTHRERVLKPLGERALEDLRAADRLGGADERERSLIRAGIAYAEGRGAECTRILGEAIDAGRAGEEHFKMRGDALFGLAREIPRGTEEHRRVALDARADYDRALDLRPNWGDALYMRGALRFELLDGPAGIEDFQAALKVNARDADAWHGLGTCYERTGKPAEAEEAFTRGLACDPRHIKCLTGRGIIRHFARNYEGARADYEAALAVNPRFYTARINRATLLTNLKQDNLAIQEFDVLAEEYPEVPDVFGKRGRVFYRLGEYGRCVEDLERAVRLGDRDPETKMIIESARKLRDR